jgi:hypothetical protein
MDRRSELMKYKQFILDVFASNQTKPDINLGSKCSMEEEVMQVKRKAVFMTSDETAIGVPRPIREGERAVRLSIIKIGNPEGLLLRESEFQAMLERIEAGIFSLFQFLQVGENNLQIQLEALKEKEVRLEEEQERLQGNLKVLQEEELREKESLAAKQGVLGSIIEVKRHTQGCRIVSELTHDKGLTQSPHENLVKKILAISQSLGVQATQVHDVIGLLKLLEAKYQLFNQQSQIVRSSVPAIYYRISKELNSSSKRLPGRAEEPSELYIKVCNDVNRHPLGKVEILKERLPLIRSLSNRHKSLHRLTRITTVDIEEAKLWV